MGRTVAGDLLLVLAAMGVALAAAGWLGHRLRLPPALGYLAVGLVAGFYVRAGDIHIAEDILHNGAEIGVLFLLFLIGLELDIKTLRQVVAKSAMVLPFDLLVPAVAAMGVARLFGWGLVESIALGLAAGLSSTLFGERLAKGQGLAAAPRQRVIGTLVAEDVAAVGFLAVLLILGGGSGEVWVPFVTIAKLGFLLILLAAAALLVVPRLLDAAARTHAHELVVLAAVGSVVGFGYLGFWAGSAELGALLGGVAAAEAGSRFVVRNGLATLRDLSLAVFFFVSGFGVEADGVVEAWPLVLGVAAVVLVGKLFVHVPSNIGAGIPLEPSLRAGLSLATIGEFSLIIVTAAQAQGVAHPSLQTVVVGAMLVLLVAVPLIILIVPRIVKAFWRLPQRLRRPLSWLASSLRRSRDSRREDASARRAMARVLLGNILLLTAWGLVVAASAPTILRHPALADRAWALMVVYGLAGAISVPLLLRAYRAYRDLAWSFVGLKEGEREGAGKARLRLVDLWVTVTSVLLLAPVTLIVPRTLPVLVGAGATAVLVSVIAWRQLSRFHHAVENSITRVLGDDAQVGAVLDRIMEQYPWGVRFGAVAVAPGSPVAGRTIEASRITRLTGALVAVVQRRHREIVNPDGDQVILTGDTLVLMGDNHQLARAEALVVSHGEALRMTVQSRMAEVAEVEVQAGSLMAGKTPDEADVKGRTGSLLVGVWSKGREHPTPTDDVRTITAGDTLIVLGTPLQVERLRELCAGVGAPTPGWGEGA